MKVVLACLIDDYGDPARGVSFEHDNLYLPLQAVAREVVLFDFARRVREVGQAAMNREFLDLVTSERPDVVLIALYHDEFLPETVVAAGQHAATVGYFFDDDWRREFVARWAPHFRYITTPRLPTFRRYRALGWTNVLYSPFGFNANLYRTMEVPKEFDVSFVGMHHPWREFVLKRLRRAGIDARGFGAFWPSGKVPQQELVRLINASRINLNLSNSVQWDARYLLTSPRGLYYSLTRAKDREQIKARHFEIPACGGFQLTYYCEDLERHFTIGEETEVYTNLEDLVAKAQFYLEHDAERERIAGAGRVRAERDHTMEQRMRELLAAVGER